MAHSPDRLPPLDTLRAFDAAARFGSFSAAAEHVHLTHGAISRQIARLEGWLGRRLFERHGRGVTLTPDGQRLQTRVRDALALIVEDADRWESTRGAATVRVTALQSLSCLWLIPRLAALEAGDPPLRIDLMIEGRTADLGDEAIDLGLRWGRGRLPGRVSVPLFSDAYYPIASPAIAARIVDGPPERLLDQILINDHDASGWRGWFQAQGLDYRPRRQDRRFDDYNVVLDAVAFGLGIGLARPSVIGRALAAGHVVQIDPRVSPAPSTYWLDRPEGRMRPAAAELARRLVHAAGLPPDAAANFLSGSG